jgi:hypothetical protein
MLGSIAMAQLAIQFANRLTTDPALRRIAAAVDDVADLPRDDCVSSGTSSTVKTCTFGDRSSPTSLILFGDSHAIQWFNALERMAIARSWKLTTVVRSGCAGVDATFGNVGAIRRQPCSDWRHAAIAEIAKLRPTVVVMSNSTGWWKFAGRELPSRVHEWQLGTQRTLAGLSAANAPVLVIRDTPAPPFDVPICLARSVRHAWYPGGRCTFVLSTAMSAEVFASERDAAAGMSFVGFIDMTSELCPAERCAATHGDTIAFRDDNHLTGAYSAGLEPRLERAVLSAVRLP